jgi:hypothetical protein
MKRCGTLCLLPLMCATAFAQAPEPPHIIDPNLTFTDSPEGSRLLVLPKAITQLSFTSLWKRGDDRHDNNGSSFHVKDFRFPDFRYAVVNMGWGLGRGFEFGFTMANEWVANPLEAPTNYYSTSNRNGQVLTRCSGCTGITDGWMSLKWQPLRKSKVPFVIQSDLQLPEVYRHSEPLLGSKAHAFQLSAWTALSAHNVWVSPKLGYMWRGNNQADSMTYLAEIGWRPFGSRRGHGFYIRARVDGNEVTNGDKTGAKSPRYGLLKEILPGHFLTYNDAQGTRASLSAGIMLAQWNLELSYARWLHWQNTIGYKEWGLTASRPLAKREFMKGDKVLASPTESEARTQTPNSVVLNAGDIYVSTSYDWHKGQNKHDDLGRAYQTTEGRQHDFRFLTQSASFGLGKGFEVDAVIPYFWGQEQLTNSNSNSSHTGLNDIWLSVRKQILYNPILPIGVAAEFKFPEATRHADRYLGEDKHDVMFSAFTSKSGVNWWTATKWGYRWREGAYSDEIDYFVEGGWRPPFSHKLRDVYVKTLFDGWFSRHNASAPTSGDRFGSRSLNAPPDHYFTFNEGSAHRIGYGAGIRVIRGWNFEFINHEYIAAVNNNAYERDWTITLARFF